MVERGEDGVAALAQQLAEGRAAGEVSAERHDVDQIPDHPLGLPEYEVDVLARGRKRCLLARSGRLVELPELVDQHYERPEVDGDVMDGEEQDGVAVGSTEERHPKQRPASEVERPVGGL